MTVHDVGYESGQVYIVSDYLEGPDLARWLEGHHPSWPESARLAAAVADALVHAHARLIVHRDIKPANIIITAGSRPRPRRLRACASTRSGSGRLRSGIIGTPAYMVPSRSLARRHRIDGRTDIHSLGVVLYEMLCGHLPFRACNTRELLRQVRDDEPQPPRQLRPEIPPELERACLKSLAKRLHDRYTNASDFAADLSACPPADGPTSSSQLGPPSVVVPMGRTLASVSVPSRGSSQTPTSSSFRARDAERRQVTILVCGCVLFESEVYLENLDAEDQARVMRAFQQACEGAVRRCGGTVVQCSEKGLLACFGYPVAFEDAAQRAVRSGLNPGGLERIG